jgi:hypothetical protein
MWRRGSGAGAPAKEASVVEPPEVDEDLLRPLVAAEKACPDPPPEAGERVYARLAVSLGLPPGPAPVQPSPPSSTPSPPSAPLPPPALTGSAGRLALLVPRRAVTILLAGAAASVVTYATVTHTRERPVPSEARPAPPTAPTPAPASIPAPQEPPPTPAAAASPSEPARPDEPAAREGRDRTLAAERAQIDAARTALTQGRAPEAFAALRRHGRLFPHGRLAEEREALLVQALVAAGRFAEARERAARFGREHPRSLFQPVVEESLRSIP